MNQLITLLVLIPLLGYLLSLITNRKKESFIAGISIATAIVELVFILVSLFFYIQSNNQTVYIKLLTLLKTPEFDFYIAFILDKISFVFLFVGSILTLLVSIYSKFYIHREDGFKRYFNNIQLFFLGFIVVIIGGNFETLFLGWEMIGITSFLLISFYKNRYLPIKNAMKVVSLYRLGDVFLIISMWLCHHLWHQNISFEMLRNLHWLKQSFENNQGLVFFISLSILMGAAIKSAMYPFSSWVARAMEGPSSSSAIFYGSLSIHLGVFLLLRTYPIWESLLSIKIIIVLVGLFTSLICNSIAQSQPTVKTQIAYASISQIGVIFIEVAIGWHSIALLHFMGNAFFRTYQILVSPSVLHYQIHNQLFTAPKKGVSKIHNKFMNTLYMLSIKEYNMDYTLFRYFWTPFKNISSWFSFLNNKYFYILIIVYFLTGIILDINTFSLHPILLEFFVYSFALIALVLILISFTERISSLYAWLNIVFGHLFIMMSVSINSHIQLKYVLLYLSSILFFGLLGFIAIQQLKKLAAITLDQYHGNGLEHPKLSILFLISCLGLIGFPISPLYIGIDLMLTYIESHEYFIMILVGLSLIFIEISLLRVYSRLFCGISPQSKQPIAFKSS